MKLSTGILAVLGAIHIGVDAKGINCQGNARCPDLKQYIKLEKFISKISRIPDDFWFKDGEHIACYTQYLPFGSRISGCVFMQGTNGASAKSIKKLLGHLKDHNCKLCGSVPMFFPEDNDISTHGQLTVNYVNGSDQKCRYGGMCGTSQIYGW